jgi:CysZ protein
MRKVGFFDALRALPRASAIIKSHPRILRWLALPLIATLLLDAAAFYFGYGYLAGRLSDWLPSEGVLGWLQLFGKLVVGAAVLFALGIAFTFVYLTLASLVQEYISEEVEAAVLGRPGSAPEGVGSLAKSVWLSVVESALLAVASLALFAVGLVSVVGAPLAFLGNALLLGYSFFTVPASRRVADLAARRALARRHLGAALGLGLPIALSALVPVVNVLLFPIFIVAGTLLYIEAAEKP